MKTITFNGNQYECKRYSLKELNKLFHGYVVVLEDVKIIDMSNISSGVLVDVFDIEQKNAKQEQHLLEGKEYFYLDLTPEPLFASYMGVW